MKQSYQTAFKTANKKHIAIQKKHKIQNQTLKINTNVLSPNIRILDQTVYEKLHTLLNR